MTARASAPATQPSDDAGPDHIWAVLVPALIAILCYLPALRNGFALDDVIIVANDGALLVTDENTVWRVSYGP